MHVSSYKKMEMFVENYLCASKDQELRILDIGSYDVNGTYKPLFNRSKWTYIGIDMVPGNNVDLVLHDIYAWKEIKSNSVDVVISGQAFEHIEYFWHTIFEIRRVLKKGALCCIIAPSSGFEHKCPSDCWRFYADGFRALSTYVGLEILEVYSEAEAAQYADGSELWKDSILIARNPFSSTREDIIFQIKSYLSRLILWL